MLKENFTFKVDANTPVPTVAFPGLYPIYYVTKDSGTLCPECVNDNLKLCSTDNGANEDAQWFVVASDINWENPELYCDNCECRIPSAYADNE